MIDLKDGTNVNMNCFILSMNLGSGTFYYYLSSIGLVKSSSISEPMEVTTEAGGTGETFTFSSECILIDY